MWFGSASDLDDELRVKQSDSVVAIVAKKKAAIREELSRLAKTDYWAGEYFYGDHVGVNSTILLAPESGFVFEWRGCLGLYDRNYGTVKVRDKKLELHCELPNDPDNGFEGVATSLLPLKWGDRNYLLDASKIVEFCNAYNAGEEPRTEAGGFFFLKNGDENKTAIGKPTLPDPFANYLFDSPVQARVIKIDESSYHAGKGTTRLRSTPVKLDVGRKHGVFLGAKFYLIDLSQVLFGEVSKLEEDNCTIVFEQDADSEYDLPPSSDSQFSSKARWQ